jgi:hypothetical protein
MTIADQHTQQQIADLVNACTSYWELRGIARERRDEMQLELEQHLQQAIHEGRSLEAVVGSNPAALAEAWARETPHRLPAGLPIVMRWVLYQWLAPFLAFLGLVALFSHLYFRSPTFSFTATHALIVAFFAVFGVLEAAAGFLAPRVRTREQRELLMFAIYAVISLVILVVLYKAGVPLKTTLFTWDWPVTLLVVLGAAGLFALRAMRSHPRD